VSGMDTLVRITPDADMCWLSDMPQDACHEAISPHAPSVGRLAVRHATLMR
jgi:hypothetical protein